MKTAPRKSPKIAEPTIWELYGNPSPPGRQPEGKEPDYDSIYIYASDLIREKNNLSREVPGTFGRRVHKVRRELGPFGYDYEYTFEFVDDPSIEYTTACGWELVLDTPENEQALVDWKETAHRYEMAYTQYMIFLESMSLK